MSDENKGYQVDIPDEAVQEALDSVEKRIAQKTTESDSVEVQLEPQNEEQADLEQESSVKIEVKPEEEPKKTPPGLTMTAEPPAHGITTRTPKP